MIQETALKSEDSILSENTITIICEPSVERSTIKDKIRNKYIYIYIYIVYHKSKYTIYIYIYSVSQK